VLGGIALKGCRAGKDTAEIGYWTAPAARNRGVASGAVELLTAWAFENFDAHGLRRVELLHQQDNLVSCRVAQKSGYALAEVLPADPPAFPRPGHRHVRYRPAPG
jgi:RimJ/RimL family protein N-acetyltransferase